MMPGSSAFRVIPTAWPVASRGAPAAGAARPAAAPHSLPGLHLLRAALPGQAGLGYPRLPGAPLVRPEWIRDRAAREAIASDLAGFLRRLHAIPPLPWD